MDKEFTTGDEKYAEFRKSYCSLSQVELQDIETYAPSSKMYCDPYERMILHDSAEL